MSNLDVPLPPLTLLDGGLGTTLADQHGVVFDDSTPLWSSSMLLTAEGREVLATVQRDFVREGADALLSGTYQVGFGGWARSVEIMRGGGGKERDSNESGREEAARGMRGAVGVARGAFGGVEDEKGKGGVGGRGGRRGKVVLGLGAYGATMLPGQEYSGLYDSAHSTVDQLREWHLERLSAFSPFPLTSSSSSSSQQKQEAREEREKCWEDVDMVAFETLPRIDEVLAVRQVMGVLGQQNENGLERRFWISCVFSGEGNKLPDGCEVREVVRAMLSAGVEGVRPWGVGLNCTKIGKVEGLVLEFEREVERLLEQESKWDSLHGEQVRWPGLVVYPDGTNGEVYNTTTKVWETKGGENHNLMSWDEEIYGIVQRARERRKWSEVLVGGCCKVTPRDIGRLRKRIDEGEN